MKYIAPKRGLGAFTCPHCGVLTAHANYSIDRGLASGNSYTDADPIATSVCEHCQEFVLWHRHGMVYPNRGNAPPPNPDIPADVRRDYEEAASISALSPRGAAALLRLALQRLCVHLGGKGENINDDIAKLVRDGLGSNVQRALDVVRVVGNNAVHPGQIDADDPEIVGSLFVIINVIVESMITVPGRIESMYAALPAGALKAIERRDGGGRDS